MEAEKRGVKSWILATRPWSFPASAMPVVVTFAYLYSLGYAVDWALGALTLVTIVLFHAAANCWSDYYDFIRGVDREDTIGGMSIVTGEFRPSEIRALAIGVIVVAAILGTVLLCLTGLPTLYLGLAGALLSVFYPWLKYHALGDLDIFLCYSLLPILGTSYVVTGSFCECVLWLTVPVGLITVGILHANNTRDIDHDKRADIKTFAMLVGRRASAVIYCAEVIVPFVWVAALVVAGIFPWWSFLVLVALKPALDNVAKMRTYNSVGFEAIKGVDEMTAKLQLMFSLLLALSFFIDKWV